MTLVFLFAWSYLQIGNTLVRNHLQDYPIEQPAYAGDPAQRILYRAMWPLTIRRFNVFWVVLSLTAVTSSYYWLDTLLNNWVDFSVYRMFGIVSLSLTTIPYILISFIFALIRLFFSAIQFKLFFFKALLARITCKFHWAFDYFNLFWPDEYVSMIDLSLKSAALRPTYESPITETKGPKLSDKLVGNVFLLVDQITWVSAFNLGASGEIKSIDQGSDGPSMEYASLLTRLSKE